MQNRVSILAKTANDTNPKIRINQLTIISHSPAFHQITEYKLQRNKFHIFSNKKAKSISHESFFLLQ